jgi:hypothetical protein
MASVRLGPNGEVEVLEPATAEEIAQAEAGLLKVIEALAEVAAKRDWAAAMEAARAVKR